LYAAAVAFGDSEERHSRQDLAEIHNLKERTEEVLLRWQESADLWDLEAGIVIAVRVVYFDTQVKYTFLALSEIHNLEARALEMLAW
jgi:hypothetical protein